MSLKSLEDVVCGFIENACRLDMIAIEGKAFLSARDTATTFANIKTRIIGAHERRPHP
jgi:hypothetical protein